MSDGDGEHDWPVLVVRAAARSWVRRLIVVGSVVVVGSAALIVDAVAPGIPTAVTGALVLVAFAAAVVSLAAITVRWRTSVRSDGRHLVLRDPLGVRVVPLRDGLGFTRWLDARTHQPVMWLSDRGALVAPLNPLLSPLKLEGFAHALGLPVVDVDAPPPRGH